MAQSVFLVAHGCPQQQGYLLSKPSPSQDFDDSLVAGRVDLPQGDLVSADSAASA